MKSEIHAEREYAELFVITMEECAELIQILSKIQRFGLDQKNSEHLKQELGDVYCMVTGFIEAGLISEEEMWENSLKKVEKLKKFSDLFKDSSESLKKA